MTIVTNQRPRSNINFHIPCIHCPLQGWTEIPITENPHALLGVICAGLCFMQPLIAMTRCHPDHRRRPLFNWVHWFVGNAAQIVGIVAIFFAVELDKAELPAETDYLLIAFVAFHFLMHLVLSVLMCSTDMRKDKVRVQPALLLFMGLRTEGPSN